MNNKDYTKPDEPILNDGQLKPVSIWVKIADVLFDGDFRNAINTAKTSIKPNLKQAVYNSANSLLTSLIFGNGAPSNNASTPFGNSGGWFDYSSLFNSGSTQIADISMPNAPLKRFESIQVKTREQALGLLAWAKIQIQSYQAVRVYDVFRQAGIDPPYTANSYGWRNLNEAKIIPGPNCWYLEFPRAELIQK